MYINNNKHASRGAGKDDKKPQQALFDRGAKQRPIRSHGEPQGVVGLWVGLGLKVRVKV